MAHLAPPELLAPLKKEPEIVKFVLGKHFPLFIAIAVQVLAEAKRAIYIKEGEEEKEIGERIQMYVARLNVFDALPGIRKDWFDRFDKIQYEEKKKIFYAIAFLFVGHEYSFKQYSRETLKILENSNLADLKKQVRNKIHK